MSDLKALRFAFKQARIAGEQLLAAGKITWDVFEETMRGHEAGLRAAGEVL